MPKLIGLSGYARSGKDTIAEHLVENHGFVRLAFADPIREALYKLNPYVDADFSDTIQSLVDGIGWDAAKADPHYGAEVRRLLQVFGTEVGREMFGQDVWVKKVDEQIAKLRLVGKSIVITDVRFPNEVNLIKAYPGGQVWRVLRLGVFAANDHSSERLLDGQLFDVMIKNGGTIEELRGVVDSVL